MARVAAWGILLSLAVCAWAEHPGGFRTYGSRHGFGNVVFPGMGNAPLHTQPMFSITDPGMAHRLGGIVSGFRPYTGAPAPAPGARRPRSVLVPVAFPVFIGGGYPEPAPQQAPNVIHVSTPQPAPQVVINQYFSPEQQPAQPSDENRVRVYEVPAREAVEPALSHEPTVHLIAFKDGRVMAALGYWTENETLHYITMQGQVNKASLELVDREFSRRLNQERNLEFQLAPE